MILALLGVAALSVAIERGPSARACEIVSDSTASPRSEPIRQLVAEATAIVRVRVGLPEAADSASVAGAVRMEVLSVLKPDSTRVFPATITVRGTRVDRDDYNPLPVPYAMVRSAGRRGSCFADEYRTGAEYLLLLTRADDGRWTPYWAPLMPTTEQIRGPDDPWVEWVRRQVAADRRSGAPSPGRDGTAPTQPVI